MGEHSWRKHISQGSLAGAGCGYVSLITARTLRARRACLPADAAHATVTRVA